MDADFVELRPGNRKGRFPYAQLEMIVKQDSECRLVLYKERRAIESKCEYCWEPPKRTDEPATEGDAIESRPIYFDVAPKALQGGYPRAESPTEPFLMKWATWARALALKMVDDRGNELLLENYLPRPKRAKRAPAPRAAKKESARRYSPGEVYAEGDTISHEAFGPGTVRKVTGKTVEVKFKWRVKKLAHGQ